MLPCLFQLFLRAAAVDIAIANKLLLIMNIREL